MDQSLAQLILHPLPDFILAQIVQPLGQPIIGEVLDPHRFGQQDLQGMQLLLGPGLYFTHPMVRFGEEVTEPGCGQPADAQPFPIAGRLDHLVQHFRDVHVLLLMDQQREVVYSFGVNFYFCHSGRSLPQFRFSCKK